MPAAPHQSTACRLTLPDWHSLLAAFRGERGIRPGDDLLLRWAHQLAHLHRVRHVPGAAGRVDLRRTDVVALINNWVACHVCTRPDAAARVGQGIDDLAHAYTDAEYALINAERPSAEFVHDLWTAASTRAVDWADLVAEVVDGQRPIPWHPEISPR